MLSGISLYSNACCGRIPKETISSCEKPKRLCSSMLPRTSRFGYQDANLAYQNASLMAECLGVSQFYTGFVCSAIEQDKKGTLEKKLGIDGKIYAGMALGMPAFRYKNYIDRKDLKVNRL